MSAHKFQAMSASDLKNQSGKDLLEYANLLQKALGEPVTKKFKDKAVAVRKIGALRGIAAVKQVAATAREKAESKGKKKPATKKAPVNSVAKSGKKKPADKPKKKTKTSTGVRGAKASFLRDVNPDGTRDPRVREGTTSLRQRAFEMLGTGCSVNELVGLIEDWHKEKGLKDPKIGHQLRALEIIRLLNYQNGFGFYNEGDMIYITTKQGDVDKARKKLAKAEKTTKPSGEGLL